MLDELELLLDRTIDSTLLLVTIVTMLLDELLLELLATKILLELVLELLDDSALLLDVDVA